MTDTDPISYLALEKGTPVVTQSGTSLGTVEHVLQDSALDFFDGIVVETKKGRRFVDSGQIGSITRTSVQTTVSDDEAETLPEPNGNGVFEADPGQYQEDGVTAWFGRMFLREHWTRKRDE
jgi:uncharacterized protein YrrD